MLNRTQAMKKTKINPMFPNEFQENFIHLNKLQHDKRLLFKQLSFTNAQTYYLTTSEVLKGFISDVYLDPKYALAIANFAATKFKLRTSVQVIVGQVSQMIALDQDKITNDCKEIIKSNFNKWISRPDMLADVVWTYSYITGAKISQIPTFLKTLAKKRLESFDKKSLVKHRLENREIKLKDLIKLYRPKPATVEMAKVFKEIIEGKQKLDQEEFIRLVTNSDVTKEDLKEKLTRKLEQDSNKIQSGNKVKFDIPLNALIRNLSKFQEDNDPEVINLIKIRLEDAINNNVTLLNPFDLLVSTRNGERPNLSGDIIDLLNKQILQSFENIEYRFENDFDIILDISGSMFNPEWIKITSKYIALMLTLGYISKVNTNLNLFIDGLLERDNNTYLSAYYGKRVLPTLPGGYKNLSEVYQYLDKNIKSEYLLSKPLELYWFILDKFNNEFSVMSGGTQLKSSLVQYVGKSYQKDDLVIISDEMTWADKEIDDMLFVFNEQKRQKSEYKLILINPVSSYGLTPFASEDNILRLSGLNPKIFDYAYIIHNFDAFKEKMINDLK